MKIKIFTLESKKEWADALDSLPMHCRDVYYTPEYFSLHEAENAYAKCFYLESEGKTAIYPFVMRPIRNLGIKNFSDEYYDVEGIYGYNGVASTGYDAGLAKVFYEAFSKYCLESNIIAEFTRFHPVLGNSVFSRSYMSIIDDRETVFVNLDCAYESIWEDSYDSRARNMIRKAQKNNLYSETSNSLDDYMRFYDIYTTTMQRLGAEEFYFFDKKYFENVYSTMGDNACVINVYSGDDLAASALMLFHGDYAHYHLSARNEKYSSLGAGNLLIDAAVRYSQEQECKILHLGGGHSISQGDPLMKFKSSFSKCRGLFSIGKKIHNAEVYNDLCREWELKYPEKKELYSKILLKYRK